MTAWPAKTHRIDDQTGPPPFNLNFRHTHNRLIVEAVNLTPRSFDDACIRLLPMHEGHIGRGTKASPQGINRISHEAHKYYGP